jgi:hypothetical protein
MLTGKFQSIQKRQSQGVSQYHISHRDHMKVRANVLNSVMSQARVIRFICHAPTPNQPTPNPTAWTIAYEPTNHLRGGSVAGVRRRYWSGRHET